MVVSLIYHEIYPPELELKHENSPKIEESVLDLDIININKDDYRDFFRFPLYEFHICLVICPQKHFMHHLELRFLGLSELLLNLNKSLFC